jgi:DNA-binding XRE family transcriptional regulator
VAAAKEFPADQLTRLGAYIRDQRQKARLSLRQLAELANVSNPYLSQIERGMHEPSVRVLKAIAAGLDLSADVILAEAGLLERAAGLAGGSTSVGGSAGPGATTGGGSSGQPPSRDGLPPDVETAINADTRLSADQKAALLQVYRSYLAGPMR